MRRGIAFQNTTRSTLSLLKTCLRLLLKNIFKIKEFAPDVTEWGAIICHLGDKLGRQ